MIRFIYILLLLAKYYGLHILSPKKRYTLLKRFFEEAGGSFIKFGQLLALRVDILPKKHCIELIDLFDQVKSFHYESVERIFLNELGATPEKVFKVFEKKPAINMNKSITAKSALTSLTMPGLLTLTITVLSFSNFAA